ncbi:MAG: LamG-like jellyroll fold domain-containing protein, partial [Planctomycetota bacterium]
VATTDDEYDLLSLPDVSVTVHDNDTPSVILTESGATTEVTEGGAGDDYVITLATVPTGDVVIDVAVVEVPGQSTVDGGATSTVTLNAANWDTGVTVTVAAVDDSVAEPQHTSTITHAVNAGLTTADEYDSVTGIDDVNVTVHDDDGEANLVAHWKLDETGGATAFDFGPGAYHGAVVDATWDAPGKVDGALELDGVDDYVNCGDIDAMDAAGTFTISLWFNRRADNAGTSLDTNHGINNVLFAQSSDSSNDNFELGTEGTSIEIYFDGSSGDGNPVSHDAGIVNDTWYHVAVVYDGSAADRLSIYVDGALGATSNAPNGTLQDSAGSPIALGLARPDGDLHGDFHGFLDDVRIYDRAFDAAEIQAIFDATRGPDIASQPADRYVLEGAPATFTVAATGTGALHYAWYQAGSPVGTDSDTYVISSATLAMNGDAVYCVVSDDNANAWSRIATLTVATLQPPVETVNTGAWVLTDTTGNVIGSTMLAYTDPNGDTVTYTVKGLPADGMLRLSGAAVALDDTFTQAQIDGDQLTYDAPAAAGGPYTFTFDVTDGVPDTAADISGATFDITVAEVPPGLVAWWRLDESSPSTIAADSAGTNDGTLNGNPVWQPSGGRIGGALLFDGTGDFVQATGYKGITGTAPRTV